LQWFPDRKGLAGAICIGGFGSGAVLFIPTANYIMNKFAVLP